MYVYRALRGNEFYNNILWCKEYFAHAPLYEFPKYNNYFGIEGLDLVGAHITRGNTNITPWISCTKEYDRVKHFLYDGNAYAYGLAVIKNHDKDDIVSRQYNSLKLQWERGEITDDQFSIRVRRLYLYDIRKCVLDFSSGESVLFNKFIGHKFVHLITNGEVKKCLSQREHNYAKSNSEVLVLGCIPKEDLYLLDSLKIDIIEFLKNNKIIDDLNDDLLDYLANSLRIIHSMLVDPDIEPEEMLTEPLRSTYINMDDWSKYIFECLYIYKCTKKTFLEKNHVSKKWLDFMVDLIILRIIGCSEYLTELVNQKFYNPQQKILVNC